MRRIYINVPYAEKDQAKLYGARWDPEVRRWYYTENQDSLLFVKWFPETKPVDELKKDVGDLITLKDFLSRNYGNAIGLTFKSAVAFGIPYPPESGWAKKYANRTAPLKAVTVGKKEKKNQTKRPKKKADICITGPKEFLPLCSCAIPPWEDCEHTEAAAQREMANMLSLPEKPF